MSKRIFALILTLAMMAAVLTGCSVDTNTAKISEPFNYSGYTAESYKSYTKESKFVKMSDGTKLAVDIYLPADGPEDTDGFPVVFQYTPYGRAFIVPEAGVVDKLKMKIGTGTYGDLLDRANSHDTVYGSSDYVVNKLLSNGYAYVCADMRGSGASYGTKIDFMPQLADDGKELIDWLEDQEWCDGNVGMFGGSYLGYSQLITAEKQPEALKCIVPEVTAFDGFTGEIRPGGVFLREYSEYDLQILLELNNYVPDEWIYPTAPVVDEDGDGEYSDERPIDKDGDGDFLNDYNYPEDPDDVPQYPDGVQREHHYYYLATKEHETNVPYSNLGPITPYIDSVADYGNGLEGSAYMVSPVANLDQLMESGIPIFNHGGWMDAFLRGTTELYSTLKDTNPSRMVIDAGYHMGDSPFYKYNGLDEDAEVKKMATEYLRFYDYYLKGIDNGLMDEDPILIYNMNGDGWRTEKEWPLARQVETNYYFGDENTLGTSQDKAGSDAYTVNWSTTSQWGTDYAESRWLMETPDTLPYRTEYDKLCLCYTSDAMAANTEVTGYPYIDFYVSSTSDSTGDFFVYLEDVDEKGEAVLVTEGVLNASYEKLYDNDEMILSGEKGIDVKPDLPWHGYEQAQENTEVFKDGRIAHLYFDLMPTSWVFQKGHRIRISIACADYPTYELTPQLVKDNDPNNKENVVPDITVYRDSEHPSHVVLPVIPRS